MLQHVYELTLFSAQPGGLDNFSTDLDTSDKGLDRQLRSLHTSHADLCTWITDQSTVATFRGWLSAVPHSLIFSFSHKVPTKAAPLFLLLLLLSLSGYEHGRGETAQAVAAFDQDLDGVATTNLFFGRRSGGRRYAVCRLENNTRTDPKIAIAPNSLENPSTCRYTSRIRKGGRVLATWKKSVPAP